jgi:hypothetical protein
MSNIKKIVWFNIIYASIYLLGSLVLYTAFHYVFPQPFFNDPALEIRTKIESTQDIEWLRRIALQQDDAERVGNEHSNNMLNKAVELHIALGLSVVFISVMNIFFWLKIMRQLRSESIPWWLRWV